MKYRVVFRGRSDEEGERADNPPGFLEPELEDGVVLDAAFVGRLRPDALHSSDRIEEDDGFLAISDEIWEYDVADGKDQDFKDALANSGMVIEYEALESPNDLGLT